MDIRDCFNKFNKKKPQENTTKNDFINIVKKGLGDNIIDIREYEFIKYTLDKICKIMSINKFIDVILKFINNQSNNEFTKLFSLMFNNIWLVMDNNIFSCTKLVQNMAQFYNNIVFTQNQIDGTKLIINLLTTPNINTVGLYGYAGTGKTTLITKIINFLLKNKYINSIAFVAPTHKALNVMKFKYHNDANNYANNYANNNTNNNTNTEKINYTVEFITIHKLLGYKKDFKTDGSKIFTKGTKNLLCNYDIVIIDECSMIPINMVIDIFTEIDTAVKQNKNPKIVFAGDPAQLPPVNEHSSILFSQQNKIDNINKMMSLVLKQCVRSSNPDVNNLCSDIRDWVTGVTKVPKFREYKSNVKIYKYNKKSPKTETKWFNNYLDHTQSSINKSDNSVIILTWTNDQCTEYNKVARDKLLISKNNIDSKFRIGDILIFNDYYNFNNNANNLDEQSDQNSFHTSEQIKIIEIHDIIKCSKSFSEHLPKSAQKLPNVADIGKKYKDIINHINKNTTRKYKVWKLKIQRLCDNVLNSSGGGNNSVIYVLHDDSKTVYEKDVALIKNKINELNDVYNAFYKSNISKIEETIIKHLWCELNGNIVDQFANVREGFCITTHKSQGSTFCNVFVDCHDIFKNKDSNIYMKCIYTAVTRASNKVFLLI